MCVRISSLFYLLKTVGLMVQISLIIIGMSLVWNSTSLTKYEFEKKTFSKMFFFLQLQLLQSFNFTYLFIYLFIFLFFFLFFYFFIYLFIYLFIYFFIYLFIYLLHEYFFLKKKKININCPI